MVIVGIFTVARLKRLNPIDHAPGNIGHCGEIRSALTMFYSDSNGMFPRDLNQLIPKYLSEIPPVSGLKEHRPSRNVVLADDLSATDSGGWLYVNNPKSPHYGEVRIDCTHKIGGKTWFEY